MVKCQHPKTITLYAQRREGGKRAFKPEVLRCESCGTMLSANQAVGKQEGKA